MRARQRPKKRGFTLVEVAVAIVIVGTGSVALMQLAATCTAQNRAAADTTSAVMLAQHIQEMLALLPISDPSYGPTSFGLEPGETIATADDVDDFDGVTFSPPVDSTRTVLSGFTNYSQVISVAPVDSKKLSGNTNGTDVAKSTYTGAVRIHVDIKLGTKIVHQLEWVRIED